jgi:hypothetical protein
MQAWIGTSLYVTANEGDLDGGSRGFTIFNTGMLSKFHETGL